MILQNQFSNIHVNSLFYEYSVVKEFMCYKQCDHHFMHIVKHDIFS